ncbi:WecB/TagA/CpsF family glycosyltransferase [Gordonia sesuvii]|uniref:WecB/TagA/CpsF family glycosyltransferase n=1 Tax=Gordonia sesuvii TaxID=3116777 RepID=UPI003D67D369
MLADDDLEYRDILRGPGVNFADGLPVARVLSRRNRTSTEQVRGADLFKGVIDKGRRVGVRHYFIGTTDETLRRLTENIQERFEGVAIAGTFAPPFGPLTSGALTEMASAATAADADMVWVALGTPKQDFAGAVLVTEMGLSCAAVGAAFDFVAGTVSEAPLWMRRRGLEWLYRLTQDPKRLWRRYLIGNLKFLRIVALSSVGSKAKGMDSGIRT